MGLRIVAQGVAAPVYGQALSFGLSDSIKKALGFIVPGLPLFLSAISSLLGLLVSALAGWFIQRQGGLLGALG